MLNSILFYLDANYPVLILAAAGYALYREVGAAAAGAIGQYFLNVGSLSGQHVLSAPGQSCPMILYFFLVLPLALFALVPSAHYEVSRNRGTLNRSSEFSGFWAIFFAAISANHCVIDMVVGPSVTGGARGASFISVLFGCAAAILGQLKSNGLGLPARPTITLPEPVVQRPHRFLVVEPTRMGKPGQAPPTLAVDDEHDKSQVASTFSRTPQKLRPSPASSTAYLFSRNEFFIYRQNHLRELEDLIRREPPGVLEGLHAAICRRLGRTPVAGDERVFMQAYAAQFRRRIELSYPEFFVPERLDQLAA